ncbi:hypothetical protein PIB30_026887 [Stylosanthes scabra]|uniref:Uncharacterized protein n=1 Tax=Stylosanthes scabra TaxID=79078 RepID=A0ABU6UAX3_9FABA|nr:hypothetical protein [Stylosanthes scabra]
MVKLKHLGWTRLAVTDFSPYNFLFWILCAYTTDLLASPPPMTGAGGPSEVSLERQPPTDEYDQLKRNKKVRKEGEGFTDTQILMARDEEWMHNKPEDQAPNGVLSFAQAVRGERMEEDEVEKSKDEEKNSEEADITESETESDSDAPDGIKVTKNEEGIYKISITRAVKRKLWSHGGTHS